MVHASLSCHRGVVSNLVSMFARCLLCFCKPPLGCKRRRRHVWMSVCPFGSFGRGLVQSCDFLDGGGRGLRKEGEEVVIGYNVHFGTASCAVFHDDEHILKEWLAFKGATKVMCTLYCIGQVFILRIRPREKWLLKKSCAVGRITWNVMALFFSFCSPPKACGAA